jgi:hypothetical protein
LWCPGRCQWRRAGTVEEKEEITSEEAETEEEEEELTVLYEEYDIDKVAYLFTNTSAPRGVAAPKILPRDFL